MRKRPTHEEVLEHIFKEFTDGWLNIDDVCFLLRYDYNSVQVQGMMLHRGLITPDAPV